MIIQNTGFESQILSGIIAPIGVVTEQLFTFTREGRTFSTIDIRHVTQYTARLSFIIGSLTSARFRVEYGYAEDGVWVVDSVVNYMSGACEFIDRTFTFTASKIYSITLCNPCMPFARFIIIGVGTNTNSQARLNISTGWGEQNILAEV